MYTAEDCVFFWTTGHVNGWASQWYPSAFKTEVEMGTERKEVTFPSAEHWMMLQKALLFSDIEVAHQVIEIAGTGKADLASVKALGRKVKNFEDKVWNAERDRIVFEGNMLKFQQNEEIRNKLLATGEKLIVEASPRDRIWGIGYGEKNAIKMQEKWGLNLLGKALVKTRTQLRQNAAQ